MQKSVELNGGKPLKPSQVVTGVVSVDEDAVSSTQCCYYTVTMVYCGNQLNLEPVRQHN